MKRLGLAAVCVFAIVGIALADEFNATIVKVEGSKITIQKKKKGEEPKTETVELAKSAKVVKGMFNKDDKKFTAGDAIEKGIENEMFKTATVEKGVNVRITVADDGADKGKVTQIMVTGGKGKKGGGQ